MTTTASVPSDGDGARRYLDVRYAEAARPYTDYSGSSGRLFRAPGGARDQPSSGGARRLHDERHITLDRAMWGSDHAASVEPQGIMKLVRDIRVIKAGLGDGIRRVLPHEVAVMNKLRRAA